MRVAQYKILTQILNKVEIPEYIFAFERGKSIPVMAQRHVGKNIVISLDIKDFFPSITQTMVEQLLARIGLGAKPAKTISEICTYTYFLPQGALTSPKISNILVAGTFGPKIKDYADLKGLALSIYADDITVSTAQVFQSPEEKTAFIKEVIDTITEYINEFGFAVNRKKTKVMKPFQRQYVCGSVVNAKVNLRKSERHKLRAIVHNTQKNGVEAESKKMRIDPEPFVSKVMGQLNWFEQLNPPAGKSLKDRFIDTVGKDKLDMKLSLHEMIFVKPINVVDIIPEPEMA